MCQHSVRYKDSRLVRAVGVSNDVALGGIEDHLFDRWICSGRGMRLFPETQVLKDLFDNIRLVDKADDPHLSLALGAGKRVGLIRPMFALFQEANPAELQ